MPLTPAVRVINLSRDHPNLRLPPYEIGLAPMRVPHRGDDANRSRERACDLI